MKYYIWGHLIEIYTDMFARPYPFYQCNYISNTTLVKYNIDRSAIIKLEKKIGAPITDFWHLLNDEFVFICHLNLKIFFSKLLVYHSLTIDKQ